MNAIGQRTEVNTSGTALPNVPAWLWGYDSLGQVTSADSSVSTSDRGYQYDTIGNRLFSEISNTQISNPPAATTTSYTPDALNQYSSIGNQQSAIVNPTYDFDGNAEAYPLPVSPTALSTLIWNAENRLTEVKNSSTTLEKNLYDAQFRRIATTVGTTTTLYLYDGFNCIAEYTGTTLAKARTWGMDLSGSMQGAGGVGGLLLITDHSALITHHYPTYDGNGNVSEYLEADGDVAAHFEYDPFGNIVKESYASGFNAGSFSYKFSTKPLDLATGLYYYGYRYYDPQTGRWPSRDPIEEEGGVNLYGFVGNDGVNITDILGLFKTKDEAIVAGGEEAVKQSKQEHLERVKEWEKTRDAYNVKFNAGKSKLSYDVAKPPAYEYCGLVCEKCKIDSAGNKSYEYYYTGPGTDRKNGSCLPRLRPPCKEGDDQVGTFHNHDDRSGISEPDRDLAKSFGRTGVTYDDENGKPKTDFAEGPKPTPWNKTQKENAARKKHDAKQ